MTSVRTRAPSRKSTELSARRYGLGFSWLLLLPALVVLGAIFYYPIGKLLSRSLLDPTLTLANYTELFADDLTMTVLGRTVRTAVIATLSTMLLGYPVAYLMARVSKLKAALLAGLVILPLWTSVLVRSYAWIVILSNDGLVNSLLMNLGIISSPLKMLYTEFSVWVGMTHILMPLMILPIYATLHGIPRDLAQAASSLGANGWEVFRRVTLPLSLPGVAAGSMIVFISSLAFFVTQRMLGGPTNLMLATLISQRATVLVDWPAAGALGMVLLVLTIVALAIFMRFLRLDRVLGEGSD